MDPLTYGLVECGAAFLAGAINAVAGGGSLISFPTLVWLGLPSITANATNTVAVWPGALGSMWGYRRELGQTAPKMYLLIAPSLVGGITGALLLGLTPSAVFDRLVPLLILFATCLFMAQEPIQRRLAAAYGLRGGAHEGSHDRSRWLAWGMLFQLLVGVYGGYFGAGIGILMLAALSLMGQDDIHQMNGLKNLLALFINGIASIYFIWMSMVSWPDV
ncbi:MAG: sulfite exporter TauE/SafE family protein, partial [Vicinamibacterales bacterium]